MTLKDPHDALQTRIISSPHTACVSCVWWHSKWETAKLCNLTRGKIGNAGDPETGNPLLNLQKISVPLAEIAGGNMLNGLDEPIFQSFSFFMESRLPCFNPTAFVRKTGCGLQQNQAVPQKPDNRGAHRWASPSG